MFFFAALFFLSLAQIALGQEVAVVAADLPLLPPDAFVEHSFFETLLSGDFFAKMLPIIVATQIMLYGLAEGLTRLSVAIDNKAVGKFAGWLSEAAWISGVIIGKFGYSTPKLVVQEKVDQAKAAQAKAEVKSA